MVTNAPSEDDGRHPDEPSIPPADDGATSQARIDANRRNAQKSTGPRTEEGKARSSQNARKSHVFVSRIEPVEDGFMAEDPKAFYERLELMVACLRPRDAVEHEVATRYAGVLIKLERLDRWSAASITGAARMRPADLRAGARSAFRVRMLAHLAGLLVNHLKGEPQDDLSYESLARMVREYSEGPRVQIRELWDDDNTPSTPQGWKTALRTLTSHHWPNESDALEWAEDLQRDFWLQLDQVEDLEEIIAANRILKGPFDLHVKYETRLFNNLQRVRSEYEALQRRTLPPEEAS